MKVGVIGAGPAGITAAYQLAKSGVDVEVFEASPHVGGMSRTIELWGQRVDLGPHRFFSSDRRVNELWLEVVGRDYAMVDRLTRVYYNNRFFQYPLQPLNAFANLGPAETARCLTSYFTAHRNGRVDTGASFEDWVVDRFGRRLFEIFFKTYSEKLWGIPCDELDADFAAQRIKKLSLTEAVKAAFGVGGRHKHKTLVDKFAYPLGGTGMVYQRMAAAVERLGGAVHLRTPVQRVVNDGFRITGLELPNGDRRSFDYVVSTMPLTLMLRSLAGVPQPVLDAAASLRFRNTTLVYLRVPGTDLFPDQWLYVHSPTLRMGRITNFRNWVPELYGDTTDSILALEYWSYDGDSFWAANDDDLVATATEELRSTELIGDREVASGAVVRIPRCYPVYARGYRAPLAAVTDYLRGFENLLPVGRYGAFKYNNQDHSILMGLLAAEKIQSGAGHDLWAVNTDYDSYQEAAIITETGLQAA
ncbi:MAG TPA: FAD-dependent oxidoreductase [Gemmatimonadales bacterium]|nr:FAD-dependent oxidoreductase [Gemmatimonadales bacterium]